MITRLVCLLCAVAIVSAGLAEQSLALVILSSAIVLLALTGLGEPEPPQCGQPWRRLAQSAAWKPPRLSRRAMVVVGLALVFCVLSIVLVSPTSFGVLSAVCWLAAIVAVVLLGLTMDRISVAEIVAGIRAGLTPDHRPEIGTVVAITVVAFVLRVYQLETVPLMFHGDEGGVGELALKLLNGQLAPLHATDPEWRLPYIYLYVEALSMWIFGANVVGVRMVGVVFGALGVPVVYLLGRVGWGPAAGAIAAWLFAVSHLQNHYSRIGTFVIESVPLMALVMLLLALTHEAGRGSTDDGLARTAASSRRGVWTLMLMAGLTCGFAQYFYYGSRLIPIVAAPLLLLLWRGRRITTWQAVAFGFGFLIIVAPLGAHYLEFPGRFTGRLTEVSIFQDSYVRQTVGDAASLPSALPALLAEQTRRTLHLFVRAGDQGGFYSGNTPNFDVVTAALIWLGLGAALARPRRYHEASVLVWFGLGLMLSSVLTLGAHSGQRVLIVTTAAFLFGGVLVARLLELLRTLPRARVEWLAVPAGTTLALWLLAANVSIYFLEYVPRAELSEHAEAARTVVEHGDGYHVYFLTEPYFDPNHGAIRFIARDYAVTNLKRAADFQLPPADGRGILLIVRDNHLDDLRAIETRVPGGEEERVTAPNGRLLFTVYRVPARG